MGAEHLPVVRSPIDSLHWTNLSQTVVDLHYVNNSKQLPNSPHPAPPLRLYGWLQYVDWYYIALLLWSYHSSIIVQSNTQHFILSDRAQGMKVEDHIVPQKPILLLQQKQLPCRRNSEHCKSAAGQTLLFVNLQFFPLLSVAPTSSVVTQENLLIPRMWMLSVAIWVKPWCVLALLRVSSASFSVPRDKCPRVLVLVQTLSYSVALTTILLGNA